MKYALAAALCQQPFDHWHSNDFKVTIQLSYKNYDRLTAIVFN